MNFIKLTAPNNDPVWINPNCIERIVRVSVRPQTEWEAKHDGGIKTSRIDLSGGEMQIVQETPEQIIKLINP